MTRPPKAVVNHDENRDRRVNADPLRAAVVFSRLLTVGVVLFAGGQLVGLPALSSSAVIVVAGIGLLAGLPHGGIDHLMAMRLAGRSAVPVVIVYAGLAAAAWAVLRWGGPVALLIVVALSAVHFGMGELEVTSETTGWRPARPVAAAIVVGGCGALLLPLARSGDQFSHVAGAVSPGLAHAIGLTPVRTGTLVLWLAAALIAVTAALATGHGASALDIVLIGMLGMLVQPLVAFAAWFGGWHSVRHCARMMNREPGCAALLAQGRPRSASLRLAGLVAPMSIAALCVVVALAWLTVTAPDPPAMLAEVLRVLLALTVPHMAVVWWLDRRRAA